MTQSPFPPTSRYSTVEVTIHTSPAGEEIAHLRRRFIPPLNRYHLLSEYRVGQAQRHDTLAALLLGDPEQFWRLCDANGVLRPEELTAAPGGRIRVTLPEGIPGIPSA